MKQAIISALFFIIPATAFADIAAGDACAAKLGAEPKLIYDATKPLVQPDSDLKAIVKETVINLVMGGNVSKDTAEASAKLAGPCLVKLK
jgi:hypothetical protein